MPPQNPLAVLDVAGSRLVTRRIRGGSSARAAFHVPATGRAVEIHVSPNGDYEVLVGPDAVHGGEFEKVHQGSLGEGRS